MVRITLSAATLILTACVPTWGVTGLTYTSRGEVARLIGEIEDCYEKLSEIEREYGELMASLPAYNAQTERARRVHEKTERQLESKRKTLESRLVAMYKRGRSSWIEVMFESGDFFEFIDRTVYSERVTRSDTEALREVKAAEALARRQEEEISRRQRAIQVKCNWVIREKSSLERRIEESMRKLASIDPVLGKVMHLPQTELSRRINAFLARRRSPMTGYGIVFVQAEQRTGVSARLLVGLAAAESSCATAGILWRTNHNAWGMKGPQPAIAGGIPARYGYCYWPDWEAAIQQAADFVRHYWGPARSATQLAGYCETGGPGSDWEKRVERTRASI